MTNGVFLKSTQPSTVELVIDTVELAMLCESIGATFTIKGILKI